MKITKTLILFLISYLSFCQTNGNIVGYGEILLGESKKTLISKIGNKFSQKKINDNKYLYYKNIEISLDEYDVINEITIHLDSNITIDSFSIKKESKVDDIIKTFGEEWGYYGKKPVYLDYENGISFETEYILHDTISKNLSQNKYFLSSKIISIIISESDENSLDAFKNYEYIDGVYIPKNLDDSFTELNKLIKRKDRNNLLKNKENEFLTSQHFALGKYIRNEWGLWKASRLYLWFKEKEITHPDDISSIILKYYYRKNNQLEFNLENEIIYYKEYWNKK
ncbi:MAG: hypothetical protein A3K10_05485 [Bacteroidetes bacterium RIFCSPLOWO2_12_FULL_31_6]|nr:MAG: hypothetical protein A3K10_05485 [Bacteroidetes bacterium RIFCSPLOWO2_12_FULL_31_6]